MDQRPTSVIKRVLDACADLSDASGLQRSALGLAPVNQPSIADGSAQYTLNMKQHYAFVIIASAILSAILRRIDPNALGAFKRAELIRAQRRLTSIYSYRYGGRASAAADEKIQQSELEDDSGDGSKFEKVFAFITGPAGSGKSRVIAAVQDFARRWEYTNSIMVAATSGAAAALIGARTWHNALGVGIRYPYGTEASA